MHFKSVFLNVHIFHQGADRLVDQRFLCYPILSAELTEHVDYCFEIIGSQRFLFAEKDDES